MTFTKILERLNEAFNDSSNIGQKSIPRYSRKITKKEFDILSQHKLDSSQCIYVTDSKLKLGVYRLQYTSGDEETVLVY